MAVCASNFRKRWVLFMVKTGCLYAVRDQKALSGHKSRLMMERYNSSPDKVKVIDFSSVK